MEKNNQIRGNKMSYFKMSLLTIILLSFKSFADYNDGFAERVNIEGFISGVLEGTSYYCVKYKVQESDSSYSTACGLKDFGVAKNAFPQLFSVARSAYLIDSPVSLYLKRNMFGSQNLKSIVNSNNSNVDEIMSIYFPTE